METGTEVMTVARQLYPPHSFEKTRPELAFDYPLVWMSETDGMCSFVNRNWYRFTGQRPGEGLGLGWIQAVGTDDRKLVARLFLKANERHQPFQIEHRLHCHDGSYHWVVNRGLPRRDGQGRFVGYMGLMMNLAGRRRPGEVKALIMRGECLRSGQPASARPPRLFS
jgi:PAS domain S-box-containing protein